MIKAKDIKIGMKMKLPYFGYLMPATVISVRPSKGYVYVEYQMDKINDDDDVLDNLCGCAMKEYSEYELLSNETF